MLRCLDSILREHDPFNKVSFRKPAHVVNLETTDNFRAAKVGADLAMKLIKTVHEAGDEWQDNISGIISNFESEHELSIFHSLIFL